MKPDKKIGFFSRVVLCQQSNGYPILKYFDSIRQPWQGPLVLFKSFPLQQLNVGGPPTHAQPRLASLMTCYGSWDGDCVRSKAALLICCWPQSQALRSTSPGWRFKRGIWERRGNAPHTSAEQSHIEAHKGTPETSIPRCDAESEMPWVCRGLVHVPMKWRATSLFQNNSPVTAVRRHKGSYALPNKGKTLSCCIKVIQEKP